MFQSAIIVLALSGPMADEPANSDQPRATSAKDQSEPKPSLEKTKAEKPKQVVKIELKTTEEKAAYRAKYKKLARESFSLRKPDPGVVVPQLVNMFNELRLVEGLQKSELARMKKTLLVRMEALRQKLKRDIANAKTVEKSPTRQLAARAAEARHKRRDSIDDLLDRKDESKSKPDSRVTDSKTDLSGETKPPQPLAATEQQNAQSLINLIETTIAPSTWESNGGGGSIYYYAPLHALVIRQTGEVHRQIGGVLGNLNQ
jgi:hypothetical protein